MKKVKDYVNEQKLNLKFATAGAGKSLINQKNSSVKGRPAPCNPTSSQSQHPQSNITSSKTPSTCSRINDRQIYFTCPFLESQTPLPYPKLLRQLQNYLWEQHSKNPLYYSALMIKTLNPEVASQLCVDMIHKYITNLAKDPENPKYRAIRTGNRAFIEKIIPVQGACEFLDAVNFSKMSLPSNYYEITDPFEQQSLINGSKTANEVENENQSTLMEEFYVYKPNNGNKGKIDENENEETSQTSELGNAIDILTKVKPIKLELDRDARLYRFESPVPKFEAPDNFYQHTVDDVKQAYALHKKIVEKELVLATRAMKIEALEKEQRELMRNSDKMATQKHYDQTYAFVRVKFPNNLVLQGTFDENEKISDVVNFIKLYTVPENGGSEQNFALLTTWGQKLYPYQKPSVIKQGNKPTITTTDISKTLEKDTTLKSLKLTPTAVLIYHPIEPNTANSIHFRPEILSKLEII